jgi:hypothetical protein
MAHHQVSIPVEQHLRDSTHLPFPCFVIIAGSKPRYLVYGGKILEWPADEGMAYAMVEFYKEFAKPTHAGVGTDTLK